MQKVHTERDNMAVFFDGLTPGSTYILEVVGIIQDSISTPIGRANHTMGKLLWKCLQFLLKPQRQNMTKHWICF